MSQPGGQQQQAGAAKEGASSLKSLEKTLMDSLWTASSLQLSLEIFEPEHQGLVHTRINELVSGMKELNGMGESLRDLKVPVDLLRYVDEGGSPDTFTAELLKKCQEENQRSKGKVQAVRELREAAVTEAQKEYPEACREYLGAAETAAANGSK